MVQGPWKSRSTNDVGPACNVVDRCAVRGWARHRSWWSATTDHSAHWCCHQL